MNTQSIEPASRTFVRAASLADLPGGARMTGKLDGHVIALFHTPEGIFAVDNRCPHMGFPLDRGTVKDCILTCHWHHARFDLHRGGAFDPWADDVRAFPVKVEGGEVWVDLSPRGDSHRHRVERLRDGIERNLSLVIGKSVIAMLAETGDARAPFGSAPGCRGSPRRDVSRAVLNRQRLRRSSAAVRDASAAGNWREPRRDQAMVP